MTFRTARFGIESNQHEKNALEISGRIEAKSVKEYQSSELRSLALIGQRGGGKTSLADALAFLTGVNNRQGKVDEGTSISDYTAVEIDKRASFSTAALALPWKDVKINLIDTPGHPDYSGQVITGLQAVGNACLVIDAQNGPEAGSRAAYEIAQRYHRPIMIFINKVEKENVNWEGVLGAIKEEYGSKVAPVNIPIGSGENFRGIIDLLKMKSITFDSGG
ncbi:MAG: GTP-binding protein, partial [candidate division Zixibacteria bacterium]|nr:GTP-binding protein [candidate division Zixibacteria bacterium]